MLDTILDAPDWWRATTLAQRSAAAPALTAAQRDHGRRRRDAWRGGHMIRGGDVTLDRWHAAGLTDERLVDLLGEPPESLVERLPAGPEWRATLRDAWHQYGNATLADLPAPPDDACPTGHDHPDTAFLQLVAPLLVREHEALRARLARVADAPVRPDHPLLELPLDRLLRMVVPTLVLEVNVARVEGRLTGETPAARLASFVASLREPETALGLLAEYPVLAREVVACLDTAAATRVEFAERFLADLPALRATFGVRATGLDDLRAVAFGAGDTHDGGRTVAVVTLAGGQRLVYKPRSLSVEVHVNGLLEWLNAHGPRHPLRHLLVLDRGSHGWVEHVATAPCADRAEAARFFWRQGAYLALFYALCGSDVHLENVLAAGEHPVVVDLEALFQVAPRPGPDEPVPLLSGAAPRVVQDSVLRIGLLPERIITADETGIYDAEISGLAGGGGQLSPTRVPTYVDSGTDEIRVVRERMLMPETENRARVGGDPVNALAYREELAAGFAECYRIIRDHRGELLREGGPVWVFRSDTVRFIPRPTLTYGRLLAESWHPDLLRDALDREIFLESLGGGFPGLPDREALLASEQRQLARQDIPAFHTTVASTDLFDGDGRVARDFLARSGWDAVRARIGAMSEKDLRRQLWCVHASMSGLTVGALRSGPAEPRPLPAAVLDPELAVAAAGRVAGVLLDAALAEDGEPPSWLSVNFVGDRYWTVGHAGLDLYSGVTGIALFLAHLGEATSDPAAAARFRRPAERIAGQLVDVVDQLAGRPERQAALPIGGFGEIGGLVYVLTRLGALWSAPALLDAAATAARMCRNRFDSDTVLDVIGGTAGAALALLALHQHRPDDRLLDALRAASATLADRSVETDGGVAWQTEFDPARRLLGFAHGASGIGYAAARVAEATGDDRGYALCAGALRFERHHLSRERGNWPDLRTISGTDAYMDAWCHGAAGIGLARAALHGLPGLGSAGALLEEDLRIAVAKVRADLVDVDGRFTGIGNDSICHGDLGLAETLAAAGPVLGDRDLPALAGRCAAAVAAQVMAGTLRPGVPEGVTTPGLLMGLAGIGYGLLRAALPGRVPNVLLLEG